MTPLERPHCPVKGCHNVCKIKSFNRKSKTWYETCATHLKANAQ